MAEVAVSKGGPLPNMEDKMADDRLIVALDFHDIDDVVALVAELGDSVSFYKVGMELFYSAGAEVVPFLKNHNKKFFLDLKLHDIPNTAAEGLCSLMFQGADILNVHASGGYTMMKTAVIDFMPGLRRRVCLVLS